MLGVPAGHGLHELGKVTMGGIVGAVGDGAHGGKGQALVMAHLGDGSALHFHSQHVVPGRAQGGAQALGLLGGGDKTVTAGHQALVCPVGTTMDVF